MTFIAGFALGMFAGGFFGALIIMMFISNKIADLQDRIDELETRPSANWPWSQQERVL